MRGKTLILLAVLVITTSSSWGQSIGGVLSNGKQNATVSQHSITASDLKNLCTKKNNAACFSYLEKMGWKHQESSTTEDITTNTWALDLDYYDEDRAMAWLYVYSDSYGVEMVGYSFASDKFIRTFEQTITKAGFRPFDFSEYGENIIAGYQSSECLLFLERYGTSHKVNCIRKRGHYDRLNGKKREQLNEGGYVEYTLVEGKISGSVKIFTDKDVLAKEIMYVNGVLNGSYKEYYSDGKTVAVFGNYKDGEKQGSFNYYTRKNKIWMEEEFNSGVLIKRRKYEGNNNLITEETYNNDFGGSWSLVENEYAYNVNEDSIGTIRTKAIFGDVGYDIYMYDSGKEIHSEHFDKEYYQITVNKDFPNRQKFAFRSLDTTSEELKALNAMCAMSAFGIASKLPKGSVLVYSQTEDIISCFVDTTLHRDIYINGREAGERVCPPIIDTNKLTLYLRTKPSERAELFNPFTGKLSILLENRNGQDTIIKYLFTDREFSITSKNGVAQGPYNYLDAYGMKIDGQLSNNELSGNWCWKDLFSKSHVDIQFKNGSKHGVFSITNFSGNVVCSSVYQYGAQEGLTSLYDTLGQKAFDVFFSKDKISSFKDYRNATSWIIEYQNVQGDIITILFKKDGHVTSVQYTHPMFDFDFQGTSTYEMAKLVDSAWRNGLLIPNGLYKFTNNIGEDIITGKISSGENQVGNWTYSFPNQNGIKLIYNYYDNSVQYRDSNDMPYSGSFEYIDTLNDVKEIRKIKNGLCEEKKSKTRKLSTNKKYKEEYYANYFQISKIDGVFLYPHMPNIVELLKVNQENQEKYSSNIPSFLNPDSPSFKMDPAEQRSVLLSEDIIGAISVFANSTETSHIILPVPTEELLMRSDTNLFYVVETDPEYPGGLGALSQFISDNIQYPAEAKDADITGKVYVSFVIEKDGSVGQVKVLRDIGGGCGEEAVRVVKSMPKWKPGTQNGKPVRTQFNLPITFDLQEK